MTLDDSHPDAPASPAWLLDDGRAGHQAQVRALAGALSRRLQAMGVASPQWQWLQPGQVPEGNGDGAGWPWLIGCGRRSAQHSLALGPGYRRLQILTPSSEPQAFDWLLVPQHDGTRGPTVIRFHGALVEALPNAVDQPGLVSLLLGGPVRACRWGRRDLAHWLGEAQEVAQSLGLPLQVVCSRRTPDWAAAMLPEAEVSVLAAHAGYEVYREALSRSRRLLVSADSVSMLAEACAGTAGVSVVGDERLRGKTRAYQEWLREQGRVVRVADLVSAGVQEPVVEVERVVAELEKRGAFLGW